MSLHRITILLTIIISYLQCNSVTSVSRIAALFKTRDKFAKTNEITEEAFVDVDEDIYFRAPEKAAKRERSGKQSREMRETGIRYQPAQILQELLNIDKDGRIKGVRKSDAKGKAQFGTKSQQAKVKESQAKLLLDLGQLPEHWILYQAFVQYPAEGSVHLYNINPHVNKVETTFGLLSISSDSRNVAKLSPYSLFSVGQYVPHQLYRLASHEGYGFVCADTKLQALVIRAISDDIYAGDFVWCDWMKNKDPLQNYFTPIAGYALYEIFDEFGGRKIAFSKSMDFYNEPIDIFSDGTLYITNKVNRWKSESSWTVEMKSSESLVKDTRFHHALERTRFTPWKISGDNGSLEEDLYVFTNTFELKNKLGRGGEKDSLCLSVKNQNFVLLPCATDLTFCHWIMEKPIKSSNKVVFKYKTQW